MKIFLAHAFTGQDIDLVLATTRLIVDALGSQGHEVYCGRFDNEAIKLQKEEDTKAIFNLAFKNIKDSEAIVAVVTSPNRSIGQIMEIGVAMSQGKPVYLFEHKSAEGSSYLPRLVDKHFIWESEDELLEALKSV